MTRVFISVIIFFINCTIFGQVDFIKNNASLWLKNDTINNCNDYNNNCVLSQLENDYKIYSNDFSFFIAFKAENSSNIDIVTLKYGNKHIKIGNKYVLKQNDTITTLDDQRRAKIVSYIHSDPSFSKKGKLIIDLLDNQTANEDILEIIYIPKIISDFAKEKIETYLSLKYGLSLKENQIYRSVENDTLWNPNSLAAFSNDVTGVGNDFENFYNKKNAFNYNLNGIIISSDTIFNNNNYALWGHNNKSNIIINQSDLDNQNFRIWHFNKKVDSLDQRIFNLKIKQNFLDSIVDSLAINERIYMYVSNYNSGDEIELYSGNYYEGEINIDNDLIFDNIFLENASRFIFVKAPDMNLVARNIANCEQSEKVIFDFEGVQFPVDLTIKNNTCLRRYKVKEKDFYIDDLEAGFYTVEMKSEFGDVKTINIEVKQKDIFNINLDKTWVLNSEGLVNVFPVIESKEDNLEFQWFLENELVGNEKEFLADKQGDYLLQVSNGICQKQYNFKVVKSSNSNISVYPNPVKVNEFVFVEIGETLRSEALEIKVNDINGRLLQIYNFEKNKSLSKIKFEREGVFILNVTTSTDKYSYKVIVQ